MIDHKRLVAPAESPGVLIEPGADELRAALLRPFAGGGLTLAGKSLEELRAELRRELALAGPLVVTGHQAEFFHAGVLAKSLAASILARQIGGAALFLTVDSDTPKSTRVALPHVQDGELRRVDVPIPQQDPRFPVESQRPGSVGAWRVFFQALRSAAGDMETSLAEYEAAFAQDYAKSRDFCGALAAGRDALERAAGGGGLRDVRISRLCATPAFRAFTAHIMANAPDFAAAYNAAQSAYRTRHRIRTDQRPVPPLHCDDVRVELPFWLSPAGSPRRRLFLSTASGGRIRVYADNEEIGQVSVDVLAEPWPFEERWPLRPRALALSAFARLLLADLFIHGIGGAKYDEITDDFLRSFFGVEPLPLACITATLRLPLGVAAGSAAQFERAEDRSRAIRHAPWREIDGDAAPLLSARRALTAESDRLRNEEHQAHTLRRITYDQIKRIDAQLMEMARPTLHALQAETDRLRPRLQIERIAASREYFFALHSPRRLAELYARLAAALLPEESQHRSTQVLP